MYSTVVDYNDEIQFILHMLYDNVSRFQATLLYRKYFALPSQSTEMKTNFRIKREEWVKVLVSGDHSALFNVLRFNGNAMKRVYYT